MTTITEAIGKALGPDVRDEFPGLPEAQWVVAPDDLATTAQILRAASSHGLRVLVWGGGTHQGIGHPVAADVVVVTCRLDRVVDWQPEDLTIVVEAGMPVSRLDELLAERGQSAVLPEHPGEATVGGVVAAGASAWRRLRYGPTRDRLLEVVLVTGDGRVVTGGGRVVKNVTGYDVPRLATGSLGSLGVIGQVCLKLWPVASHAGTIPVEDAAAARHIAYRPLAVIETERGAHVYVAGTAEEVAGQAADLGSAAEPGLAWPAPLDDPWRLSLRVPAARFSDAVTEVRTRLDDVRLHAAHGVGEAKIGLGDLDRDAVLGLRAWAEDAGGALVVEAAAEAEVLDPWGAPPASVDLQRRVKDAFDPAGVVNRGRLPGRI